ncbi:Spy/CpxP family protein refolding chaperone [Cellvibrio sp. UBA7671]|uniref:Spy/CpxP family protein refolding chaperone n=1 Tax=Cellvibrio sp. UBA7671 TaxID=1946312 RepID=UPI002F35C507
MKSNKALVAGLLLLSAASIAVPTIAGGAGKNCEGKHHAAKWAEHDGFAGREFRHLGQELTLTDAQKETLKAQREANESAREALHTKLADARSALATAVDAGANDAELNALADSLGKLHAEQALEGAKAKKAFLAVLTEEQKQTLAEAKTKRLERKAERKEAREAAKS